MEIFSVIASSIGAILSIIALIGANSAKKAVNSILKKRNNLDDYERLRGLILCLNICKDSVLPWTYDGRNPTQAGRDQVHDLRTILNAQDTLKTKAPIQLKYHLRTKISRSARELDDSFKLIAENESDHRNWKAVLVTIQSLLPDLEAEEREFRDSSVLQAL